MNLVSGNLLWTSVNPIPHQYAYLTEDIECDVVIVGAGITGAVCAYYFTEAGIRTVLADKNIVGYGATSASTSLLQYEVDYDLHQLQGMIGMDNGVKSFKLCEQAVYEIEKIVNTLEDKCDFERKECFYYTTDKAQVKTMKKEYGLRKEYGFDVEFLEKRAARERFSFPVEAGIYSGFGAGQIDPYRFANALIAHSVKKGARVFENTEITNMQNQGPGITLTTHNHKKISAKKVVITTGFEAQKHIKENILQLSRTFTLATKPVQKFEGWHRTCLIRDNNTPYVYLRTTGDGRIIIGGEDIPIGGKNSNMAKVHDVDGVLEEKYTMLANKLQAFFPGIPNMEIEFKFNGLFGESKDGLPYIGEYADLPNCYFSLGYGSNGILYSVLGGRLLRDLYFGHAAPELELFRFGR